MKTRSFVGTACLVLPFMIGAAVGCSKETGTNENAAPSATASAPASSGQPVGAFSALHAVPNASAALAVKRMSRHHVGLAGVLLRGAYEFNLTDEQKATLDKAEDQSSTDPANNASAAVKTFQTDLAAGIRATKLDNAKLQTDYVAIDKATHVGLEHEAAALDTLHGALDAGQRQALVEHVKAKRVGHERSRMTGPDGGAVDMAKARLARLTGELALEDSQQKAVAALLAKDATLAPAAVQARRDAAQKRLDALLEEFAKDSFDAKKVDLSQSGSKTPHEGQERQATFTAALLGILHPDQREKLAVRTERMANRPGRNFEEGDFGAGQGVEDESSSPRVR